MGKVLGTVMVLATATSSAPACSPRAPTRGVRDAPPAVVQVVGERRVDPSWWSGESGVAAAPQDAAVPDPPAATPEAQGLPAAADALASGQAQRAFDFADGVATQAGEDAWFVQQMIRGAALRRMNRAAEAISAFERVTAVEDWEQRVPADRLWLELAQARADWAKSLPREPAQQQRQRAVGELDRAVAMSMARNVPEMRVIRARIRLAMEGSDDKIRHATRVKAVRAMETAVRDYPNHPDIAELELELALGYASVRRNRQAAEALRKLLVRRAGEPAALVARTELAKLAEAERSVQPLEWGASDVIAAARSARDRRRFRFAHASLTQLLEDSELGQAPRKTALFERALTSYRLRDYEGCIRDLETLRDAGREERDSLLRCYEKAARYDNAFAMLVGDQPRRASAPAMWTAIEIAFRGGRYPKVLEWLDIYDRRVRDHMGQRLYYRAFAHLHEGQNGEALAAFKRLRKIDGYRDVSSYYVGKLLLGAGSASDQLEGAEKLQKLVAAGWESLRSPSAMGGHPLYWALWSRKALKAAGREVEAAPRISPLPEATRAYTRAEKSRLLRRAAGAWGEEIPALTRAAQLFDIGFVDAAQRELRVGIDEYRQAWLRVRGGSVYVPRSEALAQGLAWSRNWPTPKIRPKAALRSMMRDANRVASLKSTLRELAFALDEPYRAARLSADPDVSYRARYHLRAYADAVVPQAKVRSVDPLQLWSLMYTESRFRRHVVSPVGARGALQVMPYTGRRLVERLGEDGEAFDPDTLFEIETNARLSAYYVSELWDNFNGQAPMVYASYNGGPVNVGRWLESKAGSGPLGLDDFVEQIPFNETRRYTRRVMETHAAYMWIYEGRWPAWPDHAQPGAKHDIDF
jgi:soluble lytic murein transglycosylase-like protein